MTKKREGGPVALGARIREARNSANLSQSQLAAKIGAHFTSVSDWERGKNQPSARHLLSIARVTGKPVEHFADADDEEDRGVYGGHAEMLAALAVALEPFLPASRQRVA